MEAKTTRGYRLSLQTVPLQSPVSNLNLLCHLKSPWTNLTLACNNRLEGCLSVVCVWVSVWPQAYLLWSWHWKIMTTHTRIHTHRRLIKTTCSTTSALVQRACRHRHMNTEIRLTDYCFNIILTYIGTAFNSCFPVEVEQVFGLALISLLNNYICKMKVKCLANASYTIT